MPPPITFTTLYKASSLPHFLSRFHPFNSLILLSFSLSLSLSLSRSLMANAIRAATVEDIKDPKAGKLRPATLALHKDSHIVSKVQPKIRIVHLFAPEIIKTDVENFRELVQRLTGKPTKGGGRKKKAVAWRKATAPNMGSRYGCQEVWHGEKVKGEMGEEEGRMMCMEGNGFLSGLEDVDGFFHGLGDFPLLPF